MHMQRALGFFSALMHAGLACAAMSVVTASWGLGLVLGPAIGGMTSHWSTSSVAALRALAPEGSLLNTFPCVRLLAVVVGSGGCYCGGVVCVCEVVCVVVEWLSVMPRCVAASEAV